MVKLFHILLIFSNLGFPLSLFAEDKKLDEIEGKKTQSDKTCSVISISGYLDTSYNHLERSNKFISGIFDRNFDLTENGFTLQQATLKVAKEPAKGFGALIQVVLGKDAFRIAPFGYNPYIGSNNIGFTPLQAFIEYKNSPLKVIMGQFNSLAGLESVETPQNNVFSGSLLTTFATPGEHLGVRAVYSINKAIDLTLGVNNGWDNIRDIGRDKTLEWGIIYNPSDKISFAAQVYSGQERVLYNSAIGAKGCRNLFDAYGTFEITKKITLLFNYDLGSQSNVTMSDGTIVTAIWQGFAGYIYYKFNDKWLLSLRGEDFGDNDGYRTGVIQNIMEGTMTLNYFPKKNIIIRAETRCDFSNTDSYPNISGIGVGNKQFSYAIEALYTFSNGS